MFFIQCVSLPRLLQQLKKDSSPWFHPVPNEIVFELLILLNFTTRITGHGLPLISFYVSLLTICPANTASSLKE